MNIIQCEQGSGDWFAARCARVTASHVKDVMDLTKAMKPTAKREAYLMQILTERMTGRVEESYVTAAMQWGIDQEPMARAAYEVATGLVVDTVGFVIHPTIQWAGASPDGLVGERGGLEIKCPTTKTHLEWILGDIVPPEHEWQMLMGMACTGRDWWDFSSYDPRLPDEHLQLFVRRLHRAGNESRIDAMEVQIRAFLAEVDVLQAKLMKASTYEIATEKQVIVVGDGKAIEFILPL